MESAGPEQSPPQLVPRKACGKREPKEELCSRLWPSPTFCFWAAFQVWPVICQLQPATWQDSCLSQRETLSAPTQGYRQHPDNPGENEQMALPQQDVGVAALS